jgi:hypothetical protein
LSSIFGKAVARSGKINTTVTKNICIIKNGIIPLYISVVFTFFGKTPLR